MTPRTSWFRSVPLRGLSAGLLFASVGCGGEPADDPAAEVLGETWSELVAGDWELEPGIEGYQCIRVTLTEDVLVGAMKPLAPPGTHHATLSLEPGTEPDGVFPCGVAESATSTTGLWASGVNTPPFEFPERVGMRLSAGDQLLLNLHLFNTGTETLSGRSGFAYESRYEGEVDHLSGGTLMGPVDIALPPQKETTIVGGCTQDSDVTVFAIVPHMHRLGRHMKLVAERAGEPELVLHDGTFDFEEQVTVAVPEVTLREGDRLRVECTYDNETGNNVTFGESTDEEMCFAATAHYPRRDTAVCFL